VARGPQHYAELHCSRRPRDRDARCYSQEGVADVDGLAGQTEVAEPGKEANVLWAGVPEQLRCDRSDRLQVAFEWCAPRSSDLGRVTRGQTCCV
jgi:hypothetical protein